MLTYEEFTKLGFELDEKEFDKFLPLAEIQLNIATRRYYEFHDFKKDAIWRTNAYKMALCFQILHMQKNETISADDAINRPTSVSQSIGSTSISKSYSNNNSSKLSSSTALSAEAIRQLQGTGLLYRGVRYV